MVPDTLLDSKISAGQPDKIGSRNIYKKYLDMNSNERNSEG